MVDRIETASNFDSQKPVENSASSDGNNGSMILPDSRSGLNQNREMSQKLSGAKSSSLLAKVTLASIALGTIPVLAASTLGYISASRSLNQQISAAHQKQTQKIADAVSQLMYERYNDMQVLSNLPVLTNPLAKNGGNAEQQQATLKKFIATYRVYDHVAVFNLAGNAVVQTEREKLPNQKNNKHFQQALQSEQPVMAQPTANADGTSKIYFFVPIQDASAKKVAAIARVSMPVTVVESAVQASSSSNTQYQVFNADGKFFVAEAKERLGRSVKSDFSQFASSLAAQTSSTLPVTFGNGQAQLVSYTPLAKREGAPDLKWGLIVGTDQKEVFAPKAALLLQFLIGGGLTALVAGALAGLFARRMTQPLLYTTKVANQVSKGDLNARLLVNGEDELATVGNTINQMAEQIQKLQLEQSVAAKRAKLVAELTSSIRQTLDFDTILRTSVEGVRQVLNVDRTVIYRFNPDFKSGEITAESVNPGWGRALGQTIHDPLLPDSIDRYKKGRVTMVENLATADLTRCHCEILERLEVKANIVAPIMAGDDLIGLLCAHQCSGPRKWNESEIELIQQLATQIGYAISQASLLKQQHDTAVYERLASALVARMRESFDEAAVMRVAVQETRSALKADRTLVYLFDEKWAGEIVAESVDARFPMALHAQIYDPCFAEGYVEKYRQGRVQATNDIANAGLTECHLNQLKPFEVKANLVAPILVNDRLIGLFIAHQCAETREWSELDSNFMKQVAIQLGFALEQAELFVQREKARLEAANTAIRERQLAHLVTKMRESFEPAAIMQVAVKETRDTLKSDRTLVYLFDEKWAGEIAAESVDARFPMALHAQIYDPCFAEGYIEKYRQGRVQATNDIANAGLTECHLNQLKPFEVKANLVAPILVNDRLIGLFIAHQCAETREWSELDTNFMKQVAIQLGFALEQADLIQKQTRGAEQAYLLKDMMVSMRQSLKRENIFNITTDKLRYSLKADRVVVYQFNPDWSGTIIAESVGNGWRKILNQTVNDPFREGLIEEYRNGRVRAMNDVANENIADCHRDILEGFEIRASVVAPILRQGELLGLLSVHQCVGARHWQEEEVGLVGQVATQLTFALEQADLFEAKEQARLQAETISHEQSRQREALQMQLVALLGEVEGAARGDLTVRADVTAGEIGTVADFFNSIIESLRQIVTQVKVSATQVNESLGANEEAMRSLAEEALRQAEETTRTLDSVEEMTHSIQTVATSARRAAEVAQNASLTAEAGGDAIDRTVQNILNLRETVGETAKKVKRLGESSQQISKVVSLINQIAMQTNLLAINAGIEAARAGEEGQGFAVVAEEVGELAARSAAATQEIEKIVENIQRETSQVVEAMEQSTAQVVEGTHLVEGAKHSLSQILDVSHQIAELVKSISEATVSQVETSESVSRLMKQVATVSKQTSESSRQVSTALRQTVTVAEKLQESVGTFKVETEV